MNTRHEYLAVDSILYTDEVLFPKVIAAVSANFKTPNVISLAVTVDLMSYICRTILDYVKFTIPIVTTDDNRLFTSTH